MLVILILCSILSGRAMGFWDDGSTDPSLSHLGRYVVNMTCDDDGDTCQACYTAFANGRVYSHIVEYTTEPHKFQYTILAGQYEDNTRFIQRDPSEAFRLCSEVYILWGVENDWKLIVCIDSNVPTASVPAECAKPLAVVSLESHRSDKTIRGQQALLCLPPAPATDTVHLASPQEG